MKFTHSAKLLARSANRDDLFERSRIFFFGVSMDRKQAKQEIKTALATMAEKLWPVIEYGTPTRG